MAKDPAFLFYPNDYIGGTMGMTFEEKGAYMELLMMQFNRGRMTSHMIGQTVGQIWVKLEDKFEKDEKGLYFNARLEHEQKKRKAFTDSRRNNKSGKNQYSKKGGHTTSHMENENENENIDIDILEKSEKPFTEIYPTFDDFWELYDKKVDKKKSKSKWKDLKQGEKELIMDYVPIYIQTTPDKKYRRDPATFINNQTWENEIILTPKQTKEQRQQERIKANATGWENL